MSLKPWSVRLAIEERARKESEVEWAQREEHRPLPKAEKIKIIRDNPGMWNLIRGALREFKP